MKFLVVIFGLILLYWPRLFAVVQQDRWFSRWQAWVGNLAIGARAPVLDLVITLAVPVLAVWWLLAGLEGEFFGLPYFFINILVLVYAFGRGDSREQVEELLEALRRGDMQAAFHDLAFFTAGGDGTVDGDETADRDGTVDGDGTVNSDETVNGGETVDDQDRLEHPDAFVEELKARLAYSYFERHLAVVFWFLVAGAPLALLYRLSVLYQQRVRSGERPQLPASGWLWLMEWLPLRIVGFTLALVGHFQTALGTWRELLLSGWSSQRVLLAVVNAAMSPARVDAGGAATDSPDDGETISQVVKEVEGLFYSAIVCWLILISVILILA